MLECACLEDATVLVPRTPRLSSAATFVWHSLFLEVLVAPLDNSVANCSFTMATRGASGGIGFPGSHGDTSRNLDQGHKKEGRTASCRVTVRPTTTRVARCGGGSDLH
jgi:hypothetical protein